MGDDRREGLGRLAAASGGLFTLQQAKEAGWRAGVVRSAAASGEVVRLRQGVYTSDRIWSRAPADRRHRLVLMAHQRVDPRLVAFGVSAAAALGLPLPDDPHLQDPLRTRPSLRALRRGEPGVKLRSGPSITTYLAVIVDCVRVLPVEWGLAVADAAVARGLIGMGDLQPGDKVLPIDGLNGPRGIRKARWVLDHVQPDVESPLESLARAVIILGGLGNPKTQQWVKTRAGSFRVDMLDEKTRVITEADGKVKYEDDDRSVLWKEKGREDALRDESYEVVRFTMADYYQRTRFWARYRGAVARARRFLR